MEKNRSSMRYQRSETALPVQSGFFNLGYPVDMDPFGLAFRVYLIFRDHIFFSHYLILQIIRYMN